MFLTRLGFGSKIVVTGDVTQVDLPGGARSGLHAAVDILDGIDDIHVADLTSADVVRHRLVSEIVDAYEQKRGPGLRTRAPSRRVTRRGQARESEPAHEYRGIQRVRARRLRRGADQCRTVRDRQDERQPRRRTVDGAARHRGDGRSAHALDGSARPDRRDELPDGRARTGRPARRRRPRPVDARRHRAVPAVRRRAGGRGRARPRATSWRC